MDFLDERRPGTTWFRLAFMCLVFTILSQGHPYAPHMPSPLAVRNSITEAPNVNPSPLGEPDTTSSFFPKKHCLKSANAEVAWGKDKDEACSCGYGTDPTCCSDLPSPFVIPTRSHSDPVASHARRTSSGPVAATATSISAANTISSPAAATTLTLSSVSVEPHQTIIANDAESNKIALAVGIPSVLGALAAIWVCFRRKERGRPAERRCVCGMLDFLATWWLSDHRPLPVSGPGPGPCPACIPAPTPLPPVRLQELSRTVQERHV